MKNSKLAMYFNIGMVLFVLLIIYLSIGYSPRSRLMPLMVGIVTLVLIVVQFMFEAVPSLSKYASYGKIDFEADLLKSENVAMELTTEQKAKKKAKMSPEEKQQRLITIWSWIAGLGVALFVVGFLIALPLFLLLFLRINAGLTWLKSSVMTAVTSGVLYVVFSMVLHMEFYGGLLGMIL